MSVTPTIKWLDLQLNVSGYNLKGREGGGGGGRRFYIIIQWFELTHFSCNRCTAKDQRVI